MLAVALLSATLQAHALGLSLGIGNVFGPLATQSGTQMTGDGVDQVLQQLSTEYNEKMPVNLNASTRLDKVTAEPGRHFTYHYTVVGISNAGNMPIDFSKEIKPQLKDQFCGNTESQKLLKNGITVSYQYQDTNGRELGDAEFTPSDCGYKS
jgi:hypothetical protein